MRSGGQLFRLLEIATVGFPFCAYKLLTGHVLMDLPHGWPFGWLLVGLGAVDLGLNAIGFYLAAIDRPSSLAVCTAQWVVSRVRPGQESWRQLGLSIDTMLSFALVAAMIGFGWLVYLPHASLGVWSGSVVANVLGAGLGQLADSVRELQADRPPQG
jgi:hypothetical protein